VKTAQAMRAQEIKNDTAHPSGNMANLSFCGGKRKYHEAQSEIKTQ